jgi:hypothetical protein
MDSCRMDKARAPRRAVWMWRNEGTADTEVARDLLPGLGLGLEPASDHNLCPAVCHVLLPALYPAHSISILCSLLSLLSGNMGVKTPLAPRSKGFFPLFQC